MDIFRIEPLWGQGVEQLIGAVIFLLLFVAQMLKAYFEARAAQVGEKKLKDSEQELAELLALSDDEPPPQPKPRRERKRSQRKQPILSETGSEDAEQKSHKFLSRDLAPQGEGSRFEAMPGTLDPSQLVAPTIEPTVKTTLESMTGIYEAAPTSSEAQPQPMTLDIQRLIARPEGIRQAVILAEILKRPEF